MNCDKISDNGNRKVALITGITGQDGSYLAEFLLEKGYEVHGVIRRSSSFNTGRIEKLYKNPYLHQGGSMKLHYGDMTDSSNLMKLMANIQPTEIYNLAAQSHVKISFDLPEYTAEVDAMGTLRLLDAILASGLKDKVRFYQASTSELYGKVQEIPQNEKTPFYPRSPYGENFVTRKITRSVAKISLGQQEFVELGNLNSKRDWGHARDYVEAMWLMLQQEKAQDFVIASNETHSVREFVELAFKEIGVDIGWKGSDLNEIGFDKNTNAVRVKVNPKYYRPTEVDLLLGDSSKAQKELGWKCKVPFEALVKEMVAADVTLMKANPLA